MLVDTARYNRLAFAQKFIGRVVEMVVESREKSVGWTGEYLKCAVVEKVPRKSLVRVIVTKAKGDALEGRISTPESKGGTKNDKYFG